MKYEELCRELGKRPFFESLELEALFGKPEAAVLPRISRWVQQGKLIQLRRGKYLLPPQYHRSSVEPEYIANFLYRPSYVSLYSALQYYNMIPEAVNMYQSVTTRQTADWDTAVGRFRYFSTGPQRFFGYTQIILGNADQQVCLLADPEKALIDVCYFSKGNWTQQRWSELRLQNFNQIDREKLVKYGALMNSRKIDSSINQLIILLDKPGAE